MAILSKISESVNNSVNSLIDAYYAFDSQSLKKAADCVSNFFLKNLQRVGSKTRDIGISVRNSIEEFLDSIVNILNLFIDSSLRFLVNGLINIIRSSMQYIETAISNIASSLSFDSLREGVFSYLSLLIILLAVSMPASSITTSGRFALAVLSAVVYFSKSFLKSTLVAFFLAVLSKFSATTNINTSVVINSTLQTDPREVRADVKTLLMNVISTGILFSAATTGLDFPTDAKSWDKLLQRHSLLHKSFIAWDFGIDKLTELFESSARIVCKYMFGAEYTSINHIQEVENLLLEVMELSTLEKQFQIGKDEELSVKIEMLYTQYLQLGKIYCNNSSIKKKLDVVSGPLTAYYRRVTNKNPRANAMRKEPVVIALKGGTGLGKTYLATAFQQDLLKICGKYRPDDCLSGQIYARNIEQEFWDGYVGQPIVVFDDFGQHVDSITNPNEEFFEVIRAANIFPYMLHSAELAEKANNPFRADFIYLTTNDTAFEPKSIISKDAFKRRVHIDMEMHVIDEVKTCDLLDIEKLLQYKKERNLDEADFSHVYFVDREHDYKTYTYNDLLVLIGKQYKKHVENFEGRKRMAFLKRDQKLPEGCYSASSEWTCQVETRKISSATFFNQPLHLQKRILQKGYTVYNSFNLSLSSHESMEGLDEAIDNSIDSFNRFKIADAPIVSPTILSGIVFGRPPLPDIDIYMKTRMGSVLTTNIKDVKPVPYDDFSFYEEVHVQDKSECGMGWDDPEWRKDFYNENGDYDYYKEYLKYKSAQVVLYCWEALSSLRESHPKFFKFIGWSFAMISSLQLINGIYMLCKGTGWFTPQTTISGTLVSFYYRYATLSDFRSWFELANAMVELDPRLIKLFRFAGENAKFLSIVSFFRDFFYHLLIHPQEDTKCEVCSLFTVCRTASCNSDSEEDPKTMLLECIKDTDSLYKDLLSRSDVCNQEIGDVEDITLESPNKQYSSNQKVLLESPNKQHLSKQKLVLESPNKQTLSKQKLVLESPEEVQLLEDRMILECGSEEEKLLVNPPTTTDPMIKQIFKMESGRALSDERRRKLATLEGMLSPECETLAQKALSSYWEMYILTNGVQKRVGNVFAIKGRFCLINIHFVELISNYYDQTENGFKIGFKQHGKSDIVWTEMDCIIQAKPVFRGINQTEFFLFELPREFPLAPDFTKHLVDPSELGKLTRGVRIMLAKPEAKDDKVIYKTKEGIFTRLDTITVTSLSDSSVIRTYVNSAHYDISTLDGDCGSIIMLNSNKFSRKVLGFHFAGTDGGGACSIITNQDLKSLFTELCSADPQLSDLQADKTILPDISCKVVGHVPDDKVVTHPCKSKLRPSLIFECFGPAEMQPAYLQKPMAEDGPMLKGFKKYNLTQTLRLDLINRQAVKNEYFNDCIKPFSSLGDETRILTFREACEGIPGNPYIAPLKRSKSAGYPYMLSASKGKTDWFGNDDWIFDNLYCKELERDCRKMETQIEHGIVPEVVFVATLKDEKRTLDKVKDKKTRVFSACPLHFTITFRKYFAGFIAFIMRNKIGNNCAVGTNVHSTDWADIVQHISFSGFEDVNLLAGDFSNFDGDLLIDLMDDILDVINDFYGDGYAHRRKALWQCITNSKQLIHQVVLQLFNGQPSGNPGTAIINSIYVDFLMRHAVLLMCKSKDIKRSFKEIFRLITYGDDHILSVHPQFAHLFSPFEFKTVLENLNHGYTDSFKNQITPDTLWSILPEVSFLKRTFAKDVNSSYYFAPLDLRSIREMCNWVHDDVSPSAATVLNCEGALRELIHHSEDTFDSYVAIIQKHLRLVDCVIQKPNYRLMRWQMVSGNLSDLFTHSAWV